MMQSASLSSSLLHSKQRRAPCSSLPATVTVVTVGSHQVARQVPVAVLNYQNPILPDGGLGA